MSKPSMLAEMASKHEGYEDFERLVAHRGNSVPWPRFTTDAKGLWEAYLDNLPEHRRQHYNCFCCKRFIETYGGLVNINEAGVTVPVFFENVHGGPGTIFLNAMLKMREIVRAARVTGVFYSSAPVWGVPSAGGWTHLNSPNTKPKHQWHGQGRFETAEQAMAEKKQDYIMLRKALAEIPLSAAEQAVRMLEADTLDRSEKTLGVAKWLLDVKRKHDSAVGPGIARKAYDNLLWLAVATAPPGFCHVRSTMIGTLLDDLMAGLPYETVARRWADKMHPLQYQRPTVLKEGAIKQAEELVAKMGTEGSLARRFATLEDVLLAHKPLWSPGTVAFCNWCPDPQHPSTEYHPNGHPEHVLPGRRSGGVFDHLKATARPISPLELPPTSIRWTKFRDEVLPTALEMEVHVGIGRLPFYGLVTAANPEAPPILQWDGLVEVVMEGSHVGHPKGSTYSLPRNPVSWYFYHGGSHAPRWNILFPGWIKVNAVFAAPPHWQKPEQFKHQTEMALFALKGCCDLDYKTGGLFFPETLRSEYHGVRQVLEAYSSKTAIAGKDAPNQANGLALQKGADFNMAVRVHSKDGMHCYEIDRWD